MRKIGRHTSVGTLLDIGCSNGSFTHSAKQLNWDASGIELEQSSSAIALKNGIQVFTKPLEELSFPNDHFSAVTMWQVIEHFVDPRATVREIARILKPGGIFAASTPNIRSIGWILLKERWHCIEPDVHLNLFTPRGLEQMVNDCGLKTISVETLDIKPLTVKTFLNRKKLDDKLKTSSSIATMASSHSQNRMKWLFRLRHMTNIPLRLLGVGEDIFGYFMK